ncbi:MAG TPA: PEGA domain-containing protein [Kofleriaceae bacterium]|nr:PEGA domain-containing protein [Kofleriaceae bacterium]
MSAWGRRPSRRAALLAVTLVVAITMPRASAQPAPPPAPEQAPPDEVGPEQALTQKIAVWRIDALGIETELVARLESLFRMELDRLAARALPTRTQIDKAIAGERSLQSCGGEDKCLAAIGKKLGVDVMVTGSVAALGESYILNIKAVDVGRAVQIRRIATDPLRGSPDELIDSIRVAAYRLLAPDQLHGSVFVLSDSVGAKVSLDGKVVGMTPLPAPITKLSLGEHQLQVEMKDYYPFEEKVVVRFQKSTRVTVRLAPRAEVPVGPPRTVVRGKKPWYTSKWAYAGAGVTALIIGVAIGQSLGAPTEVRCDQMTPCD